MINDRKGFTLIELLIAMFIFGFAMAGASAMLTGNLTQFKQQSKIAESNIEGLIGLEMLKQNLANAGFGLPWNVTGAVDVDADGRTWEDVGYVEASTVVSVPDPANFNDSTRDIDADGDPGEAPRGILSGNNAGFNGSDYLVIKSAGVARNFASGRWTILNSANVLTTWTPARENVNVSETGIVTNTVRVIVLSPGTTAANGRSLVMGGGAFFATYDNTASFVPSNSWDFNIVYGIDSDTNLRMPFNRVDYYINNANAPQHCAPNTGVLVQATVNHSDGLRDIQPILDCVADYQIIFRGDTNNDGNIDWTDDDINTLNDVDGNGAVDAQDIRDQLREVRVYVLAQEGQRDTSFTYPNANVTVGEFGQGSIFNLNAAIGAGWQNYRWRVYTMIVKPGSLR